MNITTAIIYYVCIFVLACLVITGECFIGSGIRKNKNKKLANNQSTDV